MRLCRSSGCIDALAKVTRAALEASEREPEEGRAMEAAADAHLSLQALWRLLSRPAETGSGNTSDGSSLCVFCPCHHPGLDQLVLSMRRSWTH